MATPLTRRRILLYGANGYTGHLAARLAREGGANVDLVLAGRNGAKVEAVAKELGYDARVFDLDTPSTIDACLEGIGVVLHCAGPFARTSRPMADACLRMGVHYLDVTGEIGVFEALAARHFEAHAAGVMLMPGVGFDVVPSDCLIVHVAGRIEAPTRVKLGILGLGARLSHGTATTAAEGLRLGTFIRKGGALTKISTGSLTTKIDFGRGPKLCLAAPLGDVATAYRSTGIGDIECYLGANRGMLIGARAAGLVPWLVGSSVVQRFIKGRIDKAPAGPSDAERAEGKSILWAEVENAKGERAAARLETPEGYTLTAHAALAIAMKVVAGDVTPGYRTPAQQYGADLVLQLPGGATRTDL